jgi:hypothetical protein
VRFERDGLAVWWGTGDAPAPVDVEVGRAGVSATVAAWPAHPANRMTVRYRVDNGADAFVDGVALRTDVRRATQYFRATFPTFSSGDEVAYLPLLSCAGRHVPEIPAAGALLPTSFRLSAAPAASRGSAPSQPSPAAPTATRSPFELDYLGSLQLKLREPELIGETPDGLLVNWFWYPTEGSFVGPKLNATVRALGGDWMTIRHDGIGLMDVRATVETSDGALIYVAYPGLFDLGENGYHAFRSRNWPATGPTRTTPRFHTADPRYVWLNRMQGLGIGEVDMRRLAYKYDLYVVR